MPASSELAQLLRDACAIVETPDEQAPSTRVTTANRQQLNAALKLACLRLLTAALGRGVELLDESIYRAAVGVAFRALAMRQAPLVAEARALLTRLLTPTTMPKDLVQQGLKPLMTAVARHNTATVPVLRCFARVMHLVRRRSIERQDGFVFNFDVSCRRKRLRSTLAIVCSIIWRVGRRFVVDVARSIDDDLC